MEIKGLLEKYKLPEKKSLKNRSERGDLLEKFVDRLNSDRVSAGFRKLGFATYIKKMSDAGIKSLQQLYRFYGNCEDASNFSKYWWWYIKNNKIKK